jgi:hypothetical protein
MQAQYRRNDRKYKAITQQMSITYFKKHDNDIDFRVGVIGSRKIPYILDFCQSSMNITCTCPDFQQREYKPICKHMLFIINLSDQKAMFNNLLTYIELKDPAKLKIIRDSLMAVIDKKKMEANSSESNTVSIERDDYCSICMCDLDTKIEKCSICSHVMHISCIVSWWNMSNSWNGNKGKCPYCKDLRGFSHIKKIDEDPWKLFDFHIASEESSNLPILAEPSAPEEDDISILAEPSAPEEDDISVLAEPSTPEEDDISVLAEPSAPEEETVYYQYRNVINFLIQSLSIIERNHEHFEILQQQHDEIQDAFQAQEE